MSRVAIPVENACAMSNTQSVVDPGAVGLNHLFGMAMASAEITVPPNPVQNCNCETRRVLHKLSSFKGFERDLTC